MPKGLKGVPSCVAPLAHNCLKGFALSLRRLRVPHPFGDAGENKVGQSETPSVLLRSPLGTDAKQAGRNILCFFPSPWAALLFSYPKGGPNEAQYMPKGLKAKGATLSLRPQRGRTKADEETPTL